MYYWNQAGTGFVAYKTVGSHVFVVADPIGPRRAELVTNFTSWVREHRQTVCYLPISAKSLTLYQQAELRCAQIGASAVVDIKKFLDETAKNKWWRWRLNKSAKSGYVYRISNAPHASALLDELKDVSDRWLAENGRQEHSFALGYFDTNYLQQCTIHYLADGGGRVVAFTNQLPAFCDESILTVDLLRSIPESDAMAYLLYSVMLDNRARFRKFDLGFVPFAITESSLVSIARVMTARKFSSAGLEQFKRKFDPEWVPNFLAYDGDIADLASTAIAIEQVMAFDGT
jgi:phosphatidylglycerol lysyltransferase